MATELTAIARRRLWMTAVVALLLTAHCAGSNVLAQTSPENLWQLSTLLEQRYPTVRSLVLARGDCVVFEHYRKDTTAEVAWPVYSVTKSVLSILVGIAVDKGLLRLDQQLPELLAEKSPPSADPQARERTLRDLLTMTAGLDSAAGEFNYDDRAADLISAILTRATGNGAQFAQQHLFAPMGITSYHWMPDPEGNLRGSSGLRLTGRDMARIGLLHLRQGQWGGRRLVSNAYVADSTRRHNGGGRPVADAGYGYLWWVHKTRSGLDAYFAAGSGSQLIYVVPERNLVVTIASAASIQTGSVAFVNDIILPAEAVLDTSATCLTRLDR